MSDAGFNLVRRPGFEPVSTVPFDMDGKGWPTLLASCAAFAYRKVQGLVQ